MRHARRRARQAAVQAIYQWQIAQQNIRDIELQFREEHAGSQTDMEYFDDLLRGVAKQVGLLDEAYGPHLKIALDEVSPVEKAILRVATYELLQHPEVPYRVILNEAIDLAKRFGADQAHKFINGVLDKVSAQVRSIEFNAAKKQAE